MSFSLRLFGAFAVAPALEPVSRKGQWVLALLALRGGREVERSWVAGTLWPDTPEAQARYNLRRELSGLRRALGDEARRLLTSARTLRPSSMRRSRW
jgi:DNA-binding SARP family transcriptional activator